MVTGLARLETGGATPEPLRLTPQPQIGDALDVLGLREHVQRDHIFEFKDTAGAQGVQVPRQRGRMT